MVGETVAQIALPAMAAVQSQVERLRGIFLDMLRLTAAASIPMQVGALVLADLGIRIFLGDKWLGAAPVFRAYLVLWLLRTLLNLGDSLTSATGRPQIRLAFDLIQLPLFAAGTWFGLQVWGGIAGVAWTLAIVRLAVGCLLLRRRAASRPGRSTDGAAPPAAHRPGRRGDGPERAPGARPAAPGE